MFQNIIFDVRNPTTTVKYILIVLVVFCKLNVTFYQYENDFE